MKNLVSVITIVCLSLWVSSFCFAVIDPHDSGNTGPNDLSCSNHNIGCDACNPHSSVILNQPGSGAPSQIGLSAGMGGSNGNNTVRGSADGGFGGIGTGLTAGKNLGGGGMKINPAHHSGILSTGGITVSGIGDVYVSPSMIYRTYSLFTHDESEGANLNASFDAKVRYIDTANQDYAVYRDDMGNIYWYVNSTAYPTRYTPIGAGLDPGSRTGSFSGFMRWGDGTSTLYTSDNRTRKFAASGYVIEDGDRNGNKIIYVRDTDNFVTQIQIPVESGYSRTITINYAIYYTDQNNVQYKRLNYIQYPDGIKYTYTYNSTSTNFYLTQITVTDSSNTVLDFWTYEYESLTGKVVHTVYSNNGTNTNVLWRLMRIKDRNGDIIERYYYDDNFDNIDNLNYANEIKKVGDKDTTWLLESPVIDNSWNSENQVKSVFTNSNGALFFYETANTALHMGKMYLGQLDFSSTNTSVSLYETTDAPTYYSVFKADEKEVSAANGNMVSNAYLYAQYGTDTKTMRIQSQYWYDQPQYNDGQLRYYSSYTSTLNGWLGGGDIVNQTVYTYQGSYQTRYEYALSTPGTPLKKVVIEENDANYNIVHQMSHDSNGNVTQYTNPLTYSTGMTYTTKGQLSTVTSPMNRVVQYFYTNYGDLWKIVDPSNRTTEFTYNTQNSNLLTVKTPMNRTTTYGYDTVGRMTSITDPNTNVVMTVAYDDPNHKITVTDGEGTSTEYRYYPSNKQFTVKDNLDGTVYTTTYTLNDNKTVNNVVFPDNTTTSFTYDKLLRAKQVTTTNGSTSSSLLLKQDNLGYPREVQATLEGGGTQTTYYTYASDMSLDTIQELDGKQIGFWYDKILRTNRVDKTTGNSQTTSQTYTYNKADQLTQTALGSLVTVNYGYNKDGQLRFIKRSNKTITIYTYATDGRLSGVYHKKDVSNNTTYTTSTDALANTSDDLDLTNLSYTINNDGEITARSRGIYSPAGTLSRTVSMGAGYDNAGRLTSETYNGGGQYSISRTNAYDKANNRTSVVQGGVTSTYTNYPGNRLQSVAKSGVSTRFTYDTLGRMTCSWIDTDGYSVVDTNEVRTYYRWTYSGLLKEVETWKNVSGTLTQTIVRYTYDESGTGLLYIREVVGGTKTRFHWEGYDLYLEEVQSGTTWNSKYAYMNQPSAIGSTVARFDLGANYTLDSTDTYYFYHYDEAGNVILITDKNGNVVDHFEQDAWGNDLNSTFTTARAISQHQTSKFYDTTTGLYFFGARWYYPEIGRFISVSPLAPTGEEEYVYCGADAVNYVDVDGYMAIGKVIIKGVKLIKDAGIRFTLGRITIKQAVRMRKLEKNIEIIAKNEKAALRLGTKIEEKAFPNCEHYYHGKDAHKKGGNQPHLQTKNVEGHIFLKYPGSAIRNIVAMGTASYWLGDNVGSSIIDIFNPFSTGQDVVDLHDFIFN